MTMPGLAGYVDRARFGLLGPLQVVDAAGTTRPVLGGKQRVVLAALLFGAGGSVSAAGMPEALWDGCGHQAAALDVYRDAHRTLAEELGVAPGPALRETRRNILAADYDLSVSPRTASGTGSHGAR